MWSNFFKCIFIAALFQQHQYKKWAIHRHNLLLKGLGVAYRKRRICQMRYVLVTACSWQRVMMLVSCCVSMHIQDQITLLEQKTEQSYNPSLSFPQGCPTCCLTAAEGALLTAGNVSQPFPKHAGYLQLAKCSPGARQQKTRNLGMDTCSTSTGRQPLTHVICYILDKCNYTGPEHEGKSEVHTAPSSP